MDIEQLLLSFMLLITGKSPLPFCIEFHVALFFQSHWFFFFVGHCILLSLSFLIKNKCNEITFEFLAFLFYCLFQNQFHGDVFFVSFLFCWTHLLTVCWRWNSYDINFYIYVHTYMYMHGGLLRIFYGFLVRLQIYIHTSIHSQTVQHRKSACKWVCFYFFRCFYVILVVNKRNI